MTNNVKKIALIYDFDKTLTPKNMQEYTLFNELNITADQFWAKTNKLSKTNQIDSVLAYMFQTVQEFKSKNIKLTRLSLNEHGKHIDFFDGVETFFKRIEKYANEVSKDHNVDIQIEHYIISVGLKEIIEATKIAKYFKKIFASEFYYIDDEAIWPKVAINYTGKTQYLFRINKGVLDLSDDDSLNKSTPESERAIPFSNMIYLGDGYTDVPAMKLVKQLGGHSIALSSDQNYQTLDLVKGDRVNFVCEANYSENSKLDKTIKLIIQYIAKCESSKEFII